MTSTPRSLTHQPSILVATDLPVATDELTPVMELAKLTGWQLHLLHVAAPPMLGGATEPYDADLAHAGEALDAEVARLGDAGLVTVPHLVVGPTIETILSEAESLGVSMIAVIGHRHHVAHRIVLGSVVASLLKVAPVPVMVLPAPSSVAQPDSGDGLTSAMERLRIRLERDDTEGDLDDLRDAAAAHLEHPEKPDWKRRLGGKPLDALHRFETEHPDMARAISDVSYYMNTLGI